MNLHRYFCKLFALCLADTYQHICYCVVCFCININECISNLVENEGTCNDTFNSYTCDFTDGYTGAQCEIGIVYILRFSA